MRSNEYAVERIDECSEEYALESTDESSDKVAHKLTDVYSRQAFPRVRPRVH